MCGSCNDAGHTGGKRRWTSQHLIVGLLLATLAALAIVDVAGRVHGGGSEAARCADVTAAWATYTAVVTRDLPAGAKPLLADTSAFAARARAGRDARCPDVPRFAENARTVLAATCAPCAARLDRLLR